ncbi:hypothetical protein MJO28_006426 [Puccinia striiformis f. sp. tritici]|uniref:Uncharacterized protein n=1 Tax=Puccinia striiformis f. sp. tritici TaxID=168172 RepID=A0ACC0EHE2_9BASI|nr:hypothetical protein MJO28_006426 [Puccinia striiformis f. sp. tritici]
MRFIPMMGSTFSLYSKFHIRMDPCPIVIDFPQSAATLSSSTTYVVSSLSIIGFLQMQYKHMYHNLTPLYQREEKSKPAGIGSAPITGGSISGSCSEPVF